MSTPDAHLHSQWAPQIRRLGPTCDIVTAARILGFGRTTAFELMRQGAFPVEVLAFGRVRRVRTADLLAYLHIPLTIDQAEPTAGDPPQPHAA
ncbi:MAG: helix-turn-helix domain-containing protein [Actinomycetales bacterium]|nr:helix-turn-helix domain-containing protein [Actinomycetales bacterium]